MSMLPFQLNLVDGISKMLNILYAQFDILSFKTIWRQNDDDIMIVYSFSLFFIVRSYNVDECVSRDKKCSSMAQRISRWLKPGCCSERGMTEQEIRLLVKSEI